MHEYCHATPPREGPLPVTVHRSAKRRDPRLRVDGSRRCADPTTTPDQQRPLLLQLQQLLASQHAKASPSKKTVRWPDERGPFSLVQARHIENCLPDGRACQRYPSSKPPSRPLSLASPLSREAQNERALSEAEERAHLSFSDFKRLPRYQVEDETSSGSDSDESSPGIVQFAAGDEVRHKSRGMGRVATVCPGFVTVKFYSGETKFYDSKGGCTKLRKCSSIDERRGKRERDEEEPACDVQSAKRLRLVSIGVQSTIQVCCLPPLPCNAALCGAPCLMCA